MVMCEGSELPAEDGTSDGTGLEGGHDDARAPGGLDVGVGRLTCAGVDQRLTGMHETAPWTEYSYGVSNRGASVRIPWQTERDQKGYLEDRRPNANMDPYVVTRLITDTICEALDS